MKPLMSINEASAAFGIGRNKLRELCDYDCTMPVLRIGKHKKINTVLFQKWLNEKTKKGEAV
jgi:hypothetical protein